MQYKKTKAHINWHCRLALSGCVLSGGYPEIHHCIGASRKTKINLVSVWIGQWYALPLSYWWHRDPKNPNNITQNRKGFEAINGTEKELFALKCDELGDLPFDDDVLQGIMDY